MIRTAIARVISSARRRVHTKRRSLISCLQTYQPIRLLTNFHHSRMYDLHFTGCLFLLVTITQRATTEIGNALLRGPCLVYGSWQSVAMRVRGLRTITRIRLLN